MTYRRVTKIIFIFLFVLAAALGLARSALSPEIPPQVFRNNSTNSSLEDYFKTAQTLSKQSDNTVTFNAVGDIMLSRDVASKIDKANDPTLPFQQMGNLLLSADFNFGNLESPITTSTQYHNANQFIFNAPANFATGLPTYKFALLNLANNHAADQGSLGLDFTRTFLEQQGIKHVGTAKSATEAWQGDVVTINGIRIGFIGATYGLSNGTLAKDHFVARIQDTINLHSAIKNLQLNSDYIVVTMHAGKEYTREPSKEQINFAHAAIEAGADMVIGAHPHWIQTIEEYQGKKIFYSLGNFIFDQEWSPETKEGLMLNITLSSQQSTDGTKARGDQLQGSPVKATLERIELIPVIIENYSTPRPANTDEVTRILKKINQTDTILFP